MKKKLRELSCGHDFINKGSWFLIPAIEFFYSEYTPMASWHFTLNIYFLKFRLTFWIGDKGKFNQ